MREWLIGIAIAAGFFASVWLVAWLEVAIWGG